MTRWWKNTAKVGNPQNSQEYTVTPEQKAQLEQLARDVQNQRQAIDHDKESELAKSRETARDLQLKLQSLQTAVRSIVLRLKVLDVTALEKDLGEDGTIPLRLALSELKELIRAYDGMPKANIPDYGWVTAVQQQTGTALGYATTSTWSTTTAPYNQLWMPSSYSSSSSDTGGTP
jgi:hypothetical protein